MNKLKGKAQPTVSAKKQKAQFVVLGALVLVALVMGATQLQPNKALATNGDKAADAPKKSQVVRASDGSLIAMAGQQAEQLIDQPITWDLAVRRDPFDWDRLDVAAVTTAQKTVDRALIATTARRELKLQAVMFDSSPRVLINGRLLVQGSEISGYTITKVEKRSVVVSQHGVDIRINL